MPDPAPARKPRGITCPACAVPLKQFKTRKSVRGLVVRRRRCPWCGFSLTTEERPRSAS